MIYRFLQTAIWILLLNVTVFAQSTLSISIDNPIQCFAGQDGAITAIGNPTPGVYEWSGPNGFSNTDTTGTIMGLSAGTYVVTFTDVNTQTIVDSIILTEPALLMGNLALDGCDSVVYNAQVYFSSTTIFDTIPAANGCDSLLTIDIFIGDTISPVAQCRDITLVLDSSGLGAVSIDDYEIANASVEFSGIQGQDGWEYGTYPAFNAAAYSQLPNFTGFVWNNGGQGTILDFPQLDPNGGHPQIENLNWAVRRWVSDFNGTVNLSGDFYDRDLGGGDGAHVRILLNGVQIYEYLNIPGSAQIYSFDIVVNSGDLIDFAIDPKFDAANDDTHFTAVITARGLNAGATDNCGIATITASNLNFSCANFGANNVLVTVVDGSGAIDVCSSVVTVEGASAFSSDTLSACDSLQFDGNWYFSSTTLIDTFPSGSGCDSLAYTYILIEDIEAPVANCQNINVHLDSAGQVSINPSSLDNNSTDNCGIASMQVFPDNFDCTALGANTVSFVVADFAGNTDTCQAVVTVIDSIDPVAICQDITVYLDSTGQATIAANSIEIANAAAEFSGVQGQDGWEYGVYPAFNASAFTQLPNYTGFIWNNAGQGTTLDFPQLDPNGGHPQFEGLNWAVRRWIADYSGTINLSGDFYDRDLGGGDGANVRILQNGVQVYEYLNIPGNAQSYSFDIVVNNGDQIDFAIDPKFDAANDDTHFTAVIRIQGVDNGSYDICGLSGLALSPNSFSCQDLGTNAVLLTATDSSGNNSSCAASVTVMPYTVIVKDSISACESYTWIDGITYNSSNDSSTFVVSAANCVDTVYQLFLNINSPIVIFDTVQSCSAYTWIDGVNYTQNQDSVMYVIPNATAAGCDSIFYLNFSLLNPVTGVDTISACGSYTWIDGNQYFSSNNTATFTIVGGAASGCDSIVTLDLTINTAVTGTDVQTACDSYIWIDGNQYFSSNNTATFTIPGGAVSGCDSIVTLNLTMNNAVTGTDVQTACNSFTWINGTTYNSSTTSPTYLLFGAAANGCDSTVQLDLTIIPLDVSVAQNGNTLSANATNASYQWIDCDNANAPVSGAVNQSFNPTTSGNYAVVVTDANCTDTSACYSVTIVANEWIADSPYEIYPNPSKGRFNLRLGDSPLHRLRLYNALGSLLWSRELENEQHVEIEISAASGIYLLEIYDEMGNKAIFKLVKTD